MPYLKFQDRENNIFVMEDVSDLKVVRFQLNKNKMFSNLAVSAVSLWQRQNFAHQNIICLVNSIVDCRSILKYGASKDYGRSDVFRLFWL